MTSYMYILYVILYVILYDFFLLDLKDFNVRSQVDRGALHGSRPRTSL